MLKFLSISVTVIIFLGSFELFLRAVEPGQNMGEVYELDNKLIYKLAPNKNVRFKYYGYDFLITTNSYGLRCGEINLLKQKNEFRIICLGDSGTFGWGVNFEDTWVRKLEQRLNKETPQEYFSVINFGVPGYTSFQGLNILKDRIFAFNPNLIIVSFGRNDAERRFKTEKENCKNSYPLKVFLYNLLIKTKIFTHVYVRLSAIINRIVIRFQDRYGQKNRVPMHEYIDNFKEMIKICRDKNVKLVFLNKGWNDGSDASYLKVNTDLGKMYNIPVVEFCTFKIDPQLFLFDNDHPNAHGHEVIAEQIFNVLKSGNLSFCSYHTPALAITH